VQPDLFGRWIDGMGKNQAGSIEYFEQEAHVIFAHAGNDDIGFDLLVQENVERVAIKHFDTPAADRNLHTAAVVEIEKNAFRARVAYNWRDDYVDTTAGPGSGSLPIFAKPYGVLDASIGYHLNQHVDVSVDASNLTRARFSTYFGQEIRPRFTNIFDRTFGLVVHVSM